jgi:uncharacterized protein
MVYIAVNLPVTDLERSKAFYTALGASINETFTDENAACIVWDDETQFMLLRREYFATFTTKQVADTQVVAQALVALGRDSREHVDTTVDGGLAAGGTESREAQDLGFMYGRAIEDPDGNTIEFLYMDPAAAAGDFSAYAENAEA